MKRIFLYYEGASLSSQIMQKPIVLFAPHSNASFSEMLDIAAGIEAQGIYSPLFLISWDDHAHAVSVCKKLGYQFQYHGVSAKSEISKNGLQQNESSKPRNFHLLSWMKSKLKKNFVVLFCLYLYQFSKEKIFAHRLLSRNNIHCILLIGDRHVGPETALVWAGNRLGIPSLIVPFGFSDQESSAVYRQTLENWQSKYGLNSVLNKITAKANPRWVFNYKGDALLWNPPAWLVAAQVVGIMPHNPWTLGGGAAWSMAVESRYFKDAFVEQGVPGEKIRVTGKPRYDAPAKRWSVQTAEKSRICGEVGIDAEKPLLVCAVHQAAEHGLLSWPEHWEEIEFLFGVLASLRPSANVLLSLHPKSDFNQYAPRAEKYGLIIASDHPYDQLIPICDAYVASFSSTITLAIACHKPTIVIDYYGDGYDFFDDMPGIVVCRSHEIFSATIGELFADQECYQRLVKGQAQSAAYWARFDGKATERLLETIADLILKGQKIQDLPRREKHKALPPWSQ